MEPCKIMADILVAKGRRSFRKRKTQHSFSHPSDCRNSNFKYKKADGSIYLPCHLLKHCKKMRTEHGRKTKSVWVSVGNSRQSDTSANKEKKNGLKTYPKTSTAHLHARGFTTTPKDKQTSTPRQGVHHHP